MVQVVCIHTERVAKLGVQVVVLLRHCCSFVAVPQHCLQSVRTYCCWG